VADPTPAATYAVVVGIEQYAAGPSWNLDGPASDAVWFLEYLRGHDVPRQQVCAYVEPLAANAALRTRATELAAEVDTPTQAALDDLVENRLPRLSAGYFVLFWAGHGILTLTDDRRLYTADATTAARRNVDLNGLLAALRSDVYPGLAHQAVIVDSCANYVANPTQNLTHRTYPQGAGMPGKQQFALYAASPGEYAKNLTAEKSGLMSRELRAVLNEPEAGDGWPPDLVAAAEKLAKRFVALRGEGKTRQTPGTYWYRSPTREGRFLGETGVTVPYARVVRRRLTPPEYTALLEAFLALDTMRSREDRDWVVRQLRPEIGTNIERRSADRQDTMRILDKSRYYDGLAELLHCINAIEAGSPAMLALVARAHELLPDEAPATL
jgi:hypothetical protein